MITNDDTTLTPTATHAEKSKVSADVLGRETKSSSSAIKRSSVYHLQQHLHAKFSLQHQWEVAVNYGNVAAEKEAIQKKVSLTDVSWLGKLVCKGLWVPSLDLQKINGAKFYKWTCSQGIWIVKPENTDAAKVHLEKVLLQQPKSYLINLSSVYASFELRGPLASELLTKLSSLTLTPGNHAQAGIAGVHTFVICQETGYQIHFGREFGEYLWECILDAGEEFGIRATGIDAIAS